MGGAQNRQALGVNHVGFLVDDSDAELARLQGLGARLVAPPPADGGAAGYYEVKLESPDGLPFDISHLPWPGAVR
jgi:catechol 2,3-dioxygenase-like lactoylglutathione lyase family enzyme